MSGLHPSERIRSKLDMALRQSPARSYALNSAPNVTESARTPRLCIRSKICCAFSAWAPWAQAAMSELYVTTLGWQPSLCISLNSLSASCH